MPRRAVPGRRALFASVGGLLLASGAAAADAARIAVLDWGLVQTCLALGRAPIGVPAPPWYDRYAGAPLLPPGVTDIGLLFTPNFELVQELAPDAIVIPPALGVVRPLLARIAPVVTGAIFRPAPGALDFARAGTRRLGLELGLDAAALEAACDAALDAARAALAGQDGRGLYLVSVLDERHLIVFGAGSLHQDVLTRLGLRNAWDLPVRGEFATIGAEALARDPEARIIDITPGFGSRSAAIARNPVWAALPPVRAGRVHRIGPVLGSGGLPAAARFAGLLAEALIRGAA
ncbi:MAG TPA: ABC transporter substrate-binding protein [Roseomonas sp.]